MASVERRRGSWRVRWYDEANEHKSRTFARKVDADRWAHEVEHKMATGSYIDPSAERRLFGDHAREWLAQQVWRSSTRAQVESYLTGHVLPSFEHRPLAAIRTSEVQAWVKRLADVLAPATVELVYGYFRMVMKAAVRDRLIASSPCVEIKLPKIERRPVVPLDVDQVEAIADAWPERYRAAVRLAAGTGLRQGEVFGLTLDRVDFLRRQVVVDRQLVTVSGVRPHLGPLKTPASYRTVPLPDVVLEMLAEHLAGFPVENDLGVLFATTGGEPLRRNRVGGLWRRVADEIGLVDTSFHSLRHHYASLLIRAGCSVKIVQARLGHATAAETLDTYSHLWPDDADQTRASIDAAYRRDLSYPRRTHERS